MFAEALPPVNVGQALFLDVPRRFSVPFPKLSYSAELKGTSAAFTLSVVFTPPPRAVVSLRHSRLEASSAIARIGLNQASSDRLNQLA